MASASVPVSCGAAWMLKGIFSRSAHSTSRSNTTGLTADPRANTGPPPSLCSPARFFSAPGQSVACVTSTTSATFGSSPTALVLARPPQGVPRLFPHPPGPRTLGAPHPPARPDEPLGAPPADAGEIQVSLIVHVRDLQSDLVDVTGQHEAGHALGIDGPHGVAVHIGRHLIGEGLHLVAPHAGRRRLEAGRPGGVEESFQEVHGVLGHGWRTGVGERRTRSRRRTLSAAARSEEHTSELQSLAYLVCRLLLEKKK